MGTASSIAQDPSISISVSINLGVEESLQPAWRAYTHPERGSEETGT